MLYKNRKTDKPILPPPRMRQVQVDAETELTNKTMAILKQLRIQFGNSRTQMQTIVDQYMRLVVPKLAYDSRGERDLLVAWSKGVISYHHNWMHCIKLDLSRLLMGYYRAIREGDNGPWEIAVAMWARRLTLGIDTFVLAPRENGYVLMTRFDATAERDTAEQAKEAKRTAKLDEIDARAQARRYESFNDPDSANTAIDDAS